MLLNDLPLVMLRALGATVLIEAAAAFLLGVRSLRGQAIVLLCNVMTNPLVVSLNVLCTYFCGRAGYWVSLALLEAGAFCAEALAYRRNPPCGRDPFALSAALNACSFLLGAVLNRVIY